MNQAGWPKFAKLSYVMAWYGMIFALSLSLSLSLTYQIFSISVVSAPPGGGCSFTFLNAPRSLISSSRVSLSRGAEMISAYSLKAWPACLNKLIFHEFCRYLLVGGLAFVLDFAVLYLAKSLLFSHLGPAGILISAALGFTAGIVLLWNYLGRKFLIFKGARLGRH